MKDRNRKQTKWSWADLGVRVVRPEMIADPAKVLEWIAFPDADKIDVKFYPELGRAMAVVYGCPAPFHVSLAMIRDASRNSGWDVDVVSSLEFRELLGTARQMFNTVDHIDDAVAELLIENGYFGYADLSVIEPSWLSEKSHLDLETVQKIVDAVDAIPKELWGDSIGGDEPPLDGT